MWRQTIFKNVLVIFTISYFISGSAWSKNEWNRLVVLTVSDKELGDAFGESVSISGDYAILGARFDDDNGENEAGSGTEAIRNAIGHNFIDFQGILLYSSKRVKALLRGYKSEEIGVLRSSVSDYRHGISYFKPNCLC